MAQVSKFLFDTDFADPDAGQPNVVEETEIEAPVFSEEELLSAREHGYEAGIAAGQAQALAGIEKRVGELIANLAGQMDGVAEQIAAQKALVAEDVAVLARAVATKVSGTKSNKSRLELLERMITDCMAKLYQAPEVTAHVPPDIEADLTSLLAMSDLTITVTVLADPALTGTDCRISWHGGGAERIEAQIWQEVDSLLEHYVGDTSEADANVDDAATNEQTKAEAEVPVPNAAIADEAEPIDQGLDPADYPLDAQTDAARMESILEQDDGQPPETAPGDQDG